MRWTGPLMAGYCTNWKCWYAGRSLGRMHCKPGGSSDDTFSLYLEKSVSGEDRGNPNWPLEAAMGSERFKAPVTAAIHSPTVTCPRVIRFNVSVQTVAVWPCNGVADHSS